jgi:hypothetical protein
MRLLSFVVMLSAVILSTACAEEEARWPLTLHGQELMPLDTARLVNYLNVQDTLDTLYMDYGSRVLDFEGEKTDLREFATQEIDVSHAEMNDLLMVKLENFGEFRAEFLSIKRRSDESGLEIMLEFPTITPAGETNFFPIYPIGDDTLMNVLSNTNQTPQLIYRLNESQAGLRGEIIAVKVNEQYYRKQ